MRRAPPASRDAVVHTGALCERRCAVCDCDAPPEPTSERDARIARGGRRLVLRGGTGDPASLRPLIEAATQAGFADIVVRTTGHEVQTPEAAARFAALGAHAVLVPIFSHVSAAHDRIAGVDGALVRSLIAMRALGRSGLAVEVEAPILPRRLQDLRGMVDLAMGAVGLRGLRLYGPGRALPRAIQPPAWSEAEPYLVEVLERCDELGIALTLGPTDGIPICALRGHERHLGAFSFDPRRSTPPIGRAHPEPCARCALRARCPGVAESYAAAHGAAGLRPFDELPRELEDQRSTPRRVWTDEQRDASRQVGLLVLRPTVNCNQDCVFCSANETTPNVYREAKGMMQAITRAAQRGVRRLSFSGGEPTLSKHLVDYVGVAKRSGISKIELVTNAVLLDSERKVAELADAGVTHAFVSLHAHDEALSRALTQKEGDFEPTTRAISRLLDAGIEVAINHVINARNHRYLAAFVELVHARYGGRALISLAFVTPQYKALENIEIVPRLSDVMPELRRAMYRALELGQPVQIGSRQGIPPCFLGEFAGWSDIMEVEHEARSEDDPQKAHGPACDGCMYRPSCAGLWKPYIARFGLDELAPVLRPRLTEEDRLAVLAEVRRLPPPFSVPMRFEDVPERLRDRSRERRARAFDVREDQLVRSRDGGAERLRITFAGSGARARNLARAAREVPDLVVDSVASPHAPDADLRDFGTRRAFRDLSSAVTHAAPDALVIASSTASHVALTELGLSKGLPVLLETPLAPTLGEAEALVELASGGRLLMPAHDALFEPGLDELWALGGRGALTLTRRCAAGSSDAMRGWSRAALRRTLHRPLSLLTRYHRGAKPRLEEIAFDGGEVPRRIRARFDFAGAPGQLSWEAGGALDELALRVDLDDRSITWRRVDGTVTLDAGRGPEALPRREGSLHRMLSDFREAARGRGAPSVTPRDALDTMRALEALLDGLASRGAPLVREGAPRHVATKRRAPRIQAARPAEPELPPDLLCFAPFTTMAITELRHRPVPCAQSWVNTTMTPAEEAAALGVEVGEVESLGPRYFDAINEEWSLREMWNGPLLRHMRSQMVHGGPSDRCRSSCRVILGVEERGVDLLKRRAEGLDPRVLENRALVLADIRERRAVMRAAPLEIAVGVSSHCNITCGFCTGPQGAYGELSPRRLDELVELLPTLMNLTVSGPGEPLMSPSFQALLRHISAARYPSLDLSMTTNGTLLTPAVLARHEGVRWGHIRISLNAGTAATHERMTGKKLFERVLANIDAVVALRDRMERPFRLTLSCVLSELVMGDLAAFAEIVHRAGANVVLEPMTGDLQGLSPYADRERLRRLTGECAQVAELFEARNPAIARAFAAMSRFGDSQQSGERLELLPRR